jgi:two-component system cell cycle response regulator DivK
MKTILVVEDNELNMKLLQDLLRAHHYNVLGAGAGMEGLRLAREQRPDLILLDIQLPDVSGLTVSQALKDDEALCRIPVIAVTAFAMRGDEERIRAAGCDGYLSKPISTADLLRTLHKFLN